MNNETPIRRQPSGPEWKNQALQWISEYYEAHEDSPPLVCDKTELNAHAQFIGDCLSVGIDPTHFVESIAKLQQERRHAPTDDSMIAFDHKDYATGEPVEAHVEMPLIDWINDNMDGCLEFRLEKTQEIVAQIFRLAIEQGKISPTDAADLLDASGENFVVTGGLHA